MRQTECGCLGTHPGEEEGRDPAIQAAAGDPLALHLSHAVQLQAQLVSLMAVILQCRLTYDSFLLTTTSTDSCCGALARATSAGLLLTQHDCTADRPRALRSLVGS